MNIAFTPQAWADYTYWQTKDRRLIARINQLLADVVRHPHEGIGKPEPLKHSLPGAWSRRINEEHRLVYLVKDRQLIILQARYHY